MIRNSMTLLLRTAGDPLQAAGNARQALASLDKDQPVGRVASMEMVIGETLRPSRFNTLLLGLFAVVAFVLAVVGIYGVVAWNVTQRTQEMGIRQALGANRQDVLRLVIGQGMRIVLLGLVIGLAGSLPVTRTMKSMLFEISAFDGWTFTVVSILLAGVALRPAWCLPAAPPGSVRWPPCAQSEHTGGGVIDTAKDDLLPRD